MSLDFAIYLPDLIALYNSSGDADDPNTVPPYGDCYEFIASKILILQQNGVAVDPATRLWFEGAAQVNKGTGPFSDFIRSYTAEQKLLRTGVPATAADLQNASNSIAKSVIEGIIDSGGELPTLLDVGEHDVGETAKQIFGADGVSNDGRAGWSGCVLFPILGENHFFNDLLVSNTHDTYDLVAAFHSFGKALGGASSSLSPLGFWTGLVTIADIAFSTPLSSAASIASAIASTSAYFYNAYGILDTGVYTAVIAGSMVENDIISTISAREIINTGLHGDYVQADGTGDLIDGGDGFDTVDYGDRPDASPASPITAVLTHSTTFPTAVDYTGYVSSSGSTFTDYLYNVEAIVGSGANDAFTVQDFIAPYVSLAGSGGTDTLTFEAMAGDGSSRALYFNSLTAIVDGQDFRIDFEGFEKITLSGENPDILVLDDNWDYSVGSSPIVDLGADGNFFDENGGWLRDLVDASQLGSGIQAHFENASEQSIWMDGTAVAHLMNANGIIGSQYDDEIYGPDDGIYIDANSGNDRVSGGNGADTLRGGWGFDLIHGGGGNDIIFVLDDFVDLGLREYAYGDADDDIIVSEGNALTTVEGGAGNDTYAGHDGGGTTVIFRSGDGHDRIENYSAVGTVEFAGFDADDLKIVWAAVAAPGQSGGAQSLYGDLAIVVKATGESILFEDVGGFSTTLASGETGYSIGDLDGGRIQFGDGSLSFGDWIPTIDVEISDVSDYDIAPHYEYLPLRKPTALQTIIYDAHQDDGLILDPMPDYHMKGMLHLA